MTPDQLSWASALVRRGSKNMTSDEHAHYSDVNDVSSIVQLFSCFIALHNLNS